MSQEDLKWCWSANEEMGYQGNFNTRQEALDDARSEHLENRAGSVWVGRVIPWQQVIEETCFPHAINFLEEIQQLAGEEVGDVVDYWDLPKPGPEIIDLHNRLKKAFFEWMKDHDCEPQWWKVDQTEEVHLPAFCSACDKEFEVDEDVAKIPESGLCPRCDREQRRSRDYDDLR